MIALLATLFLVSVDSDPDRGSASEGTFTIGFLLAMFLLTLGLIKTIIIILFILVGFIVGKSRDENVSIVDQVRDIFKRDKDDDTELDDEDL